MFDISNDKMAVSLLSNRNKYLTADECDRLIEKIQKAKEFANKCVPEALEYLNKRPS